MSRQSNTDKELKKILEAKITNLRSAMTEKQDLLDKETEKVIEF